MQQIFAWLFLLVVLAEAATAEPKGVVFAQAEFVFTADYGETIKEFDLPFANHTEKTVKVLSVETSCSCMKVTATEKLVEPGATGRVHCVFQVPNVTGPVQKLVLLHTDAPEGGLHVVRVRVDVPSALTLTPDRLTWAIGASADEKLLRITVAAAAAPVNIAKVECPGDLFAWTLKTIHEGREFELRVKPKTTETFALGVFQIQTDSKTERQRQHRFHAAIEARDPVR